MSDKEPKGHTFRNAVVAASMVGSLGASAPGLPPLPTARPAAVAVPLNEQGLAPTVPLLVPDLRAETPTQTPSETEDVTFHHIQSKWSEDFQPSSEFAQEVRSAVDECFQQINRRQNEGALLTGVTIGALSSGEDNVTNPGDPMANLGQPSNNPNLGGKDNVSLAQARGEAGLVVAKEEAPSFGIHPDMIQRGEFKEVDPNQEELSQIVGYAKLLGMNPLELIQQYNRGIQEGLQPLMQNVFEGNRGLVCTASLITEDPEQEGRIESFKVILVPLENGQFREVEVPDGVLIRPLLYVAYLLGQQPAVKPKPQVSSIRAPKEVGRPQNENPIVNNSGPHVIKQPSVHTNFHNSGKAGHRANSKQQGSRRSSNRSSQKGSRNGSRNS